MADHGGFDAPERLAEQAYPRAVRVDPALLPGELASYRDAFVFVFLIVVLGLAEVEQVRWALVPDGLPQERVYGLPYFAARYGERAFVARVIDAIANAQSRNGIARPIE